MKRNGIKFFEKILGNAAYDGNFLVANFTLAGEPMDYFLFCCRTIEVSHRTGGQFDSLWKAVVPPEKFCFDVSNGAFPFEIPQE